MIVDSSAVVAILLQEPGHEELVAKLATAPSAAIGAPTLTECGMVLTARLGTRGRVLLDAFLARFGLVEVPFGERHWRIALDAFETFGKGRHPASLNFGDCMSYSVARLANRPLLCIGNDFPRTDLPLA
ncbi:MAG TPA: type II toxin-antitoxin system VapC family toxin [Longimicrobium sp.]|nr:type II toxin-antitoxin system VapC family toxin [Longimicrobium sp.]